MMSYLWILLLGSLLAASTKAQDEADPTVAPTEDPAAPEPTADDANQEEPTVAQDAAQDETPEENGTPQPDGESESATEETTTSQPEAEDPGTEAPQTTEPASVADPDPTPGADDTVPDTTTSTPEETTAPNVDEQPATPEDQPTSTAETTEAPSEEETTPKAVDASEEGPIHPDTAPDVHTEQDTSAGGLDQEGAKDNTVPEDSDPKPGSRSGGSATHTSGATGEGTPAAQEGSSNSIAGILSAVGVALVGAVTGFYTYQKKKFCFKNRQAADPEAARKADAAEAQSDPQVLSNLLNSS